MSSFIIAALLITIITLGLLLWPLRKNRNSISYARQAQNIHYAKERIQELEGQLENATISATDYEALKLEIENTLADDIDIAAQNENDQLIPAPRSNKLLITLLCALVPLSAAGIYSIAGTPESFELAKQPQTQLSNQDINALLTSVEQRLKENPNDIEGWTILSRSYISLGRYSEAKSALEKLMSLKGESAPLLTTLADASGLTAGGVMAGEPMAYIKRALRLDPKYPQALWMAGLGEAQAGNTDESIGYWQTLVPLLNDSPQQQQELRELIAETKQRAVAFNSEQNIADKKPETVNDLVQGGINVSVSLDPALKNNVSTSDTVFIFAKATQGPPAPLAVKRLTVADLPITIILNDNDAMLEQFKKVTLVISSIVK